MARDSGRRRNTHALDAQACDLIELPSRAAKPTVRSPRVRTERAPADCAAVPLPSAGLGRKRAVAHDVKARLSTVVTPGGSARHPIGRVHGSSVPAGETPRVPHDCRGAADRSTANGASTQRPSGEEEGRHHDEYTPTAYSSSRIWFKQERLSFLLLTTPMHTVRFQLRTPATHRRQLNTTAGDPRRTAREIPRPPTPRRDPSSHRTRGSRSRRCTEPPPDGPRTASADRHPYY